MGKIPRELNEKLNRDPFYTRCCLTGRTNERIERHHNLIFAGKQVQELWAILPLAKSVHDKMDTEIKDLCDWVMLNRANNEQLAPYCKAIDWVRRRSVLNDRFGIPVFSRGLILPVYQ